MGCGRWGWCGRGEVWARIGSLFNFQTPRKCEPGVGSGGGEGAGGCGHALAAFKYSLNTKKMRARSV